MLPLFDDSSFDIEAFVAGIDAATDDEAAFAAAVEELRVVTLADPVRAEAFKAFSALSEAMVVSTGALGGWTAHQIRCVIAATGFAAAAILFKDELTPGAFELLYKPFENRVPIDGVIANAQAMAIRNLSEALGSELTEAESEELPKAGVLAEAMAGAVLSKVGLLPKAPRPNASPHERANARARVENDLAAVRAAFQETARRASERGRRPKVDPNLN